MGGYPPMGFWDWVLITSPFWLFLMMCLLY
jgi:hypothetical protein